MKNREKKEKTGVSNHSSLIDLPGEKLSCKTDFVFMSTETGSLSLRFDVKS